MKPRNEPHGVKIVSLVYNKEQAHWNPSEKLETDHIYLFTRRKMAVILPTRR